MGLRARGTDRGRSCRLGNRRRDITQIQNHHYPTFSPTTGNHENEHGRDESKRNRRNAERVGERYQNAKKESLFSYTGRTRGMLEHPARDVVPEFILKICNLSLQKM